MLTESLACRCTPGECEGLCKVKGNRDLFVFPGHSCRLPDVEITLGDLDVEVCCEPNDKQVFPGTSRMESTFGIEYGISRVEK